MSERDSSPAKTPILLLKTKSTPVDGYEQYFSSETHKWIFEPIFAPVLEHRFEESGIKRIRELLDEKQISSSNGEYGGLVFTSQRAVEGFAKIVEERRGATHSLGHDSADGWPHLQTIPVYTVGPATFRALKTVPQNPPLAVFGSDTGNGEALANFMLDHYADWYKGHPMKPPLLFVVGEKRRDIIPKTLMDTNLPVEKRIPIEELVVYGTRVMESFEGDFSKLLIKTENSYVRWVVVFSPTGCGAMLRALGLLDEDSGKVKLGVEKRGRKTYIATIGPTTQDHLREAFGFEPDVCAAKPSAEGVGEGISRFMDENFGDSME